MWEVRFNAYRTSSNVAFLEFPELVSISTCLVYLSEGDVHKVVAVYQMAIEGLAVLELDQLKCDGQIEEIIGCKRKKLAMGLFCAALRRDKGNYRCSEDKF
jgi:hypothetical protein